MREKVSGLRSTRSQPEVVDEAAKDDEVPVVQYDITSYGADIDAEGFVNRIRRKDVFIPKFQRAYVWTQKEASRFIESLLLGLPVPGVFLARQADSKRLLVIDGQQRLKTLQFFLDGYFNPKKGDKRKKVFDLQGVQPEFIGRTYESLPADARIVLNDAIIHATIVKQESPAGDQSSIYHIFERLNTSGRKLSPQQIRVAIYNGFCIDALHKLNKHASWREMFGRESKTLKDEELILRFISLFYYGDEYSRPMNAFLNACIERLIERGEGEVGSWSRVFCETSDFLLESVGTGVFRPERALNAAVFDSVMVGTARRLQDVGSLQVGAYGAAYSDLLANSEYIHATSKATADASSVASRIELATQAFSSVPAE